MITGCGSSGGSVTASQAGQRYRDRPSRPAHYSVKKKKPFSLIHDHEEQVVSYWRKNRHIILVNCLQAARQEQCGWITDRPSFTVDVIQFTIHLQYNTIQYNTIQYNTIQYNTIQYNTIQYNNFIVSSHFI